MMPRSRYRTIGVVFSLFVAVTPGLAYGDVLPPTPPCPQDRIVGPRRAPRCDAPKCSKDDDCPANEACMKYCAMRSPPSGATGACVSDEDCRGFPCIPSYCEVGARVPASTADAMVLETPNACEPARTEPTGTRKGPLTDAKGGCKVAASARNPLSEGLVVVAMLCLGGCLVRRAGSHTSTGASRPARDAR
jgi:hypothetical protein